MSAPACVRYLRDYVAIPSVNPMGRQDVPTQIAGERRYAEHLCDQLGRLGLEVEMLGPPARPSIVARAEARGAGETFLVASHLDTVPVDDMQIDPFEPRIAEGRLYGRGACDTKGGMAALVAALERVLAAGTLRRSLLLVGEADEELGSEGAQRIVEHLGETRPDWALATEPTELRIVTAHKGIVHACLTAHGQSCHSSDPAAGRNAIVPLARAVLALEELSHTLGARAGGSRDTTPTLSVGRIEGGTAANIVPAEARLWLDRRLVPGETERSAREEIETALARHDIAEVEIQSCRLMKGALATPADHPAVQTLRRVLVALGLPGETAAASFGTDAGFFAEAGVPSLVCGPGSIAQAHTADEWVELRQVEAMCEVFVRLLEGA